LEKKEEQKILPFFHKIKWYAGRPPFPYDGEKQTYKVRMTLSNKPTYSWLFFIIRVGCGVRHLIPVVIRIGVPDRVRTHIW